MFFDHLFLVLLSCLGKELTIDPLSKAQNITQDSKNLLAAQGEWELLFINTSKAHATVLGDLQDVLVYQVRSTGYPGIKIYLAILWDKSFSMPACYMVESSMGTKLAHALKTDN